MCWIGTRAWWARDPLPCTRQTHPASHHAGGGSCPLPTVSRVYPRPFTMRQQATSQHELLPTSFYLSGFSFRDPGAAGRFPGLMVQCISTRQEVSSGFVSRQYTDVGGLSPMRRNHSWGLRGSDGSVRGRLHTSNGGQSLLAEAPAA